MKRFTLPLIVLGVLVINVGIFALRFSAARLEGIPLLLPGEEEERKALDVLARRIKAAGEEANLLLEERVRIGYEEVFAELILQGILHRDRFPLALINDRTLEEGDEIEGARVIEIKEREVMLHKGETTFTLKLGK